VLPLAVVAIAGCQDEAPLGVDPDLVPLEPQTVEVLLPWEAFGRDLQVLGGFGAPNELGRGTLAVDFAGELNARTLIRWGPYPVSAVVRDTSGVNRPDSSLTYVGGRVVLFFDTLASTNEGPVTIEVGATEVPWHAPTVSWTLATDTIGDRTPWPEPGAGPVRPLGSVVWDPAEGDSVSLAVDSATIAAWGDTTDASRGLRISMVEAGERLQVGLARLRLEARPSIRPDTLVEVSAFVQDITFVFDPSPEPPPDGLRVGGAPAWRSVLTLDVPDSVRPDASVCARVRCPIALRTDRLNQAELVLTTRASPPAFQPTDTTRLDVRVVLAPERLPKAPLGPTLTGQQGTALPPEYFGEAPGRKVVVPLTAFVNTILTQGDTASRPVNTLALLSVFEPISIAFASFDGPGSEGAPVLRLVLTVTDPVKLP